LHFDFITVLPEMVGPVMETGVVGRAVTADRITSRVVPLRAFTTDKHRLTDEPPFGGGAGMVLKPDPVVRAIRWATHTPPLVPGPPPDARNVPAPPDRAHRPGLSVILMDPAGPRFTQEVARQLVTFTHLVLVCGRYEGVDERVRAHVDQELSAGDFVLSGGELAALVMADAVARLVPGTLGNAASLLGESHTSELLEPPSYTRPRLFEGAAVPDILLSGDHARVDAWRRQQSLLKTRARQPERFSSLVLSDADQALLAQADGLPPPPKPRRPRP
jgi:tRNA (guanine37-N1)-methyltransferase